MIKLFYMEVSQAQEELVKKVYGTRAMSVLAGELAARVATAELGLDGQLTLSHKESGEPYFEHAQNLKVSISHSGNLICVALSDAAVGIDVELLKDYRENVLDRAYNAFEKKYVCACENREDKNRAFFEIWTKKEALAKSMGEGLSRALMVSVCDQYGPIYSYISGEKKLFLKTYDIIPGCIISVSSESQIFPKTINMVPESVCGFLAQAVV